jgi:hypothetical protein
VRFVPLALSIFLCAITAVAGEIRQFSVRTLERLGNELTHRDHIAEVASGLVLQTQPPARSLKAKGWISELRSSGDIVYFIAETPSGFRLSYLVTFHKSGKPEVQDRRGEALPPNVSLRYKALQTALKALKGHLLNIGYAFEVLDDPDGSGFLVYALGEPSKEKEVVLAGHRRVTVSSDGETAQRVDDLSQTLMVEDKNKSDLPKGYHRTGSYMNQIVSNRPVETLILSSYQLRQPIFVGTPDGKVWQVANGRITIDKSKPGIHAMGGIAHKILGR